MDAKKAASRLWPKIVAAAVLVPLLAGAGFMIWFGAWRYPAFELAGLPKTGYAEAMDIAGRGMAQSEGLAFEGFDFMKYRQVERGSEAFVWGAAKCRDASGGQHVLWVYLEWSGKRGQWLRNYSLVMADPEDEIFYTRDNPGQWDRIVMAVKRIWKMNRLHLAEVYGDQKPGTF